MTITGIQGMVIRNILRNLSKATNITSMCAEQNVCVREKLRSASVQCVECERTARCVADLLQLSHFGTLVCFQEKREEGIRLRGSPGSPKRS